MISIQKLRSSVALQFVFYILLFSSFAALISTTIQLFVEYRRDINTIEKTATQINTSHLSTITQAVWAFDALILEAQLRGIKNLPGVLYAAVTNNDGVLTENGSRQLEESFRSYEYPLVYGTKDRQHQLGVLTVRISLSDVYHRLRDRVLLVLLTQTIKTFFVSIFILFLFYFLVGRHLKVLAGFAESIHLDSLDKALVLSRKKGAHKVSDELGLVESAMNRMRVKLIGEMKNVRDSQEALRLSEERFQFAMTFANDGLFDWDLVTNEIYYSPVWKSLLGFRDNEIQNKLSEWKRLTKPEDVDTSLKLLDEVLNGHRDRFESEFQMRHKEGHWVDILSRANVIFDKEGRGVRVVGTHVDISQRKKMESELRESEERFRSLVESSPQLVFLSQNGRFIYGNATGVKALGYRRKEEIVGLDTLQTVSPEFRETISARMKNIELKRNNPPVEIRMIDRSGEPFWVLGSSVFVKLNGKTTAIIVGQDITERKKLENELIQSQKMEAIGTLAGGIAHDFNNILASIMGFTELALDDAKPGTTQEDNLQEVYIASKRAKDLVWQILTFARQTDEPTKPVRVDAIIKETLKLIRSSIPTTIEIERILDCDSLIMANPTQIHQILMNLCTNASHAMERSGGVLKVELQDVEIGPHPEGATDHLRPGEYIEIKVSDTGTGIPPTAIGSIFQPYFTTKATGEGTGMGLAVVQGIVEKGGGKITVESKTGEGSSFRVLLPITKKHDKGKSYTQESLPTGTERILFVDDEAPIVRLAARRLVGLGYSVTTSTNSLEALDLFRAQPDGFDLVISDMTMPNMTGDILAQALMGIRRDIPVILCTGYSKKISETSAATIGVKALVYKPIVNVDLAKKIREVLDAVATENPDIHPKQSPQ